jgi:integrase
MAGGEIMTSHTMVDFVHDYLAARRSLGLALISHGKELLLFARYCEKIGHRGPITTDLAIRWARLPEGADPIYWASRLAIVRRFARYRALFDSETEIPPTGLLGPTKRRPTPHIYSASEIDKLLKAATEIKPIHSLKPYTYVTLFGLLISTGIRISEALSLTRDSVDFENGVLTIEQTKFHKSRMVPIHPTTVKALEDYWMKRRRYCPLATSTVLFLNDKAAPINYRMALWVFMKIRARLGWTRATYGRLPTIHCFRHTFAVQRLLLWYQDGADVNQKILSLSTYLGHVEVADTYWYLTAIPQLLSIGSVRFETFVNKKGNGL